MTTDPTSAMRGALEEIVADDAGQEAYGYTDPGLALSRCQNIAKRTLAALTASPASADVGEAVEGLNACIAVAMKYAEDQRTLPNLPSTMEFQIGHIKSAAVAVLDATRARDAKIAELEAEVMRLKSSDV